MLSVFDPYVLSAYECTTVEPERVAFHRRTQKHGLFLQKTASLRTYTYTVILELYKLLI